MFGERELRCQLRRQDDHPLAESDELLGVLASSSSADRSRASCASG
jgi:hypothetical protein